jgi:hypothetical protein
MSQHVILWELLVESHSCWTLVLIVCLRRAPCSVLWLQRNRITGPLPASLSALTSLAYVSVMYRAVLRLCAVWGWRLALRNLMVVSSHQSWLVVHGVALGCLSRCVAACVHDVSGICKCTRTPSRAPSRLGCQC